MGARRWRHWEQWAFGFGFGWAFARMFRLAYRLVKRWLSGR